MTAAYDLLRGRDDLGFWGTERRWTNVLEDLRLHHQVQPEEAAARGSALLAGTAGRPPTRREMAALAAWLGRDQEALRASGTTPDAAVEEEFVRRWDALKALKLRGAQKGRGPCACHAVIVGAEAVKLNPVQDPTTTDGIQTACLLRPCPCSPGGGDRDLAGCSR